MMEDPNGDHEKDLPLMGNSHQALVYHFALDLSCDLENKVMSGCIYLCIDCGADNTEAKNKHVFTLQDYQALLLNISKRDAEQGCSQDTEANWKVVLDANDLEVTSVEEVKSPCQDLLFPKLDFTTLPETLTDKFHELRTKQVEPLKFTSEEWCLRFWGEKGKKPGCRVVKISYRTKPLGRSLRWSVDQDGRPCVYSAAMWLNNRSLFPCHELGSICTWEACVSVPLGAVGVMSGDQPAYQEHTEGRTRWYQACYTPLPSFTFAIGIGYWESIDLIPTTDDLQKPGFSNPCQHSAKCLINYAHNDHFPCRLYAPSSMLHKCAAEVKEYVSKSVIAVQNILGPSPFPRADVVVYPPCSQDMAMSNPHLLFVSQSVFPGDGSMCVRFGHELSHFWFGLLLGARDWTEEWLSEGFATFVEDAIHGQTLGWNMERKCVWGEIRAMLRHRNLQAEMLNTDQDLQTLRPNKGETSEQNTDEVTYIKNGMNSAKIFTQVHYLKGYFLLRHLSDAVGNEPFLDALRLYVEKHHGEMVTSQDFIKILFAKFPLLSEKYESIDFLFAEWLDCSGMPKPIETFIPSETNFLYVQVLNQLNKWKSVNSENLQSSRKRKHSTKKEEDSISLGQYSFDDVNQLVLLLELLLDLDAISKFTLDRLKAEFHLPGVNPDVWHRWCELVIKHKYPNGYIDISRFLHLHQAMGVYLYGEMMITKNSALRKLARSCFQKVSAEMESGIRQSIHCMLYGSEAD